MLLFHFNKNVLRIQPSYAFVSRRRNESTRKTPHSHPQWRPRKFTQKYFVKRLNISRRSTVFRVPLREATKRKQNPIFNGFLLSLSYKIFANLQKQKLVCKSSFQINSSTIRHDLSLYITHEQQSLMNVKPYKGRRPSILGEVVDWIQILQLLCS